MKSFIGCTLLSAATLLIIAGCARNNDSVSGSLSNSPDPHTFAATAGPVIQAASCNSSDVQKALSSVSTDGTTVNIPAGTCTWTSAVTYSQVYSTTIQGQSTTTGTCAPGGTCTATDSTIINLNCSGSCLSISTAAGKSFRLTGLTLNSEASSAAYGTINITGSSTVVRVDHNDVNDTVEGNHTFQIDGINGVIDHNYVQTSNGANLNMFQITNYGSDGMADDIWTQPDQFGTSNFVFLENNYFYNGFIYDCDYGGRVVMRYNIAGYGTKLQTHGVGSGQQVRGCRTLETYGNTFTFSSDPTNTNFAFVVDYESGTGMWWGNTISGFLTFLREDVVRTNTATYPQTATPNGWGFCGGSSPWDGNTNSTGYPCLDQIGRGAGQLISGDFPNKIDSATGKISWPNQALVPVYAWDNTFNPVPQEPAHYWDNYDSVSVENRDYYLQLPNQNESATFNGTAGIGQGPLSSRPSTCTAGLGGNTPGVGYWATDQNILYVCNPTNTWTAYYTPYTYPHPLVSGGTTPTSTPTPSVSSPTPASTLVATPTPTPTPIKANPTPTSTPSTPKATPTPATPTPVPKATPIPATPTPIPSTTITYVGCYTDSGTRALPINLIYANTNSIEGCVAAAKAASLKYAGLQFGGQCWGGQTLGYSQVANSQCNMPCSGNSKEICGAAWRNSIYLATGSTAPTPTPSLTPTPTASLTASPTATPVSNPTPSPSSGSYSTVFPLTENPISEGGRWINGGTTGVQWSNVRTTSGFAFGTESGSGGYNDSTAVLSGSWSSNQTAQATVSIPQVDGGSGLYEEVELRLRTTVTANSITGYEINCSVISGDPYLQIVRWNGALSSFTLLDARAKGCSNGDVLKATISGSTITAYVNGTAIFSVTDSTFTGGSPGMGFFLQGGTSSMNADFGFSQYSASSN